MRGAWGKPYGTVARVDIGQILLSVRCKDSNAHVIQEALRRARYKFPGRQKIIVSKKWGFTSVGREEYLKLKEDKLVIQCVYFESISRPPALTTFQGRSLRQIHPPQRSSRSQPPCSTKSIRCPLRVCMMYPSEIDSFHEYRTHEWYFFASHSLRDPPRHGCRLGETGHK